MYTGNDYIIFSLDKTWTERQGMKGEVRCVRGCNTYESENKNWALLSAGRTKAILLPFSFTFVEGFHSMLVMWPSTIQTEEIVGCIEAFLVVLCFSLLCLSKYMSVKFNFLRGLRETVSCCVICKFKNKWFVSISICCGLCLVLRGVSAVFHLAWGRYYLCLYFVFLWNIYLQTSGIFSMKSVPDWLWFKLLDCSRRSVCLVL